MGGYISAPLGVRAVMPSIFAHAVAGAALATAAFLPRSVPRRVWITGAVVAALPDVDAIGRPFGNLAFEALLGGHRGFTHSVMFALAFSAMVTWGFFRTPQWTPLRRRLWAAFALAVASHGVLDALSTIGNGVAFWAPFSWIHYEFGWQPLGEIGPGPRGPERAFDVVANELVWVGLPSLMVVAIARFIRRANAADRPTSLWQN
jgi:inner membrane protein